MNYQTHTPSGEIVILNEDKVKIEERLEVCGGSGHAPVKTEK